MSGSTSDFTIEFDFRGQRYNDAAAGLKAFAARTGKPLDVAAPVLAQTLKWYLSNAANAMAKRHGSSWPSGTTGTSLSIRSGNLIKSIKQSVRVDGGSVDSLRGHVGAGVPYARIQESGETISPKSAKYLAIPLLAALDSRGLPLKPSGRGATRSLPSPRQATC